MTQTRCCTAAIRRFADRSPEPFAVIHPRAAMAEPRLTDVCGKLSPALFAIALTTPSTVRGISHTSWSVRIPTRSPRACQMTSSRLNPASARPPVTETRGDHP